MFAGSEINRNDVLTPFQKGKEWTYEFTAKFQPKTSNLLMSGGEFQILADRSKSDGGVLHLIHDVNGQPVNLQRVFENANPDDSGYKERIEKLI